MSAQRYVGCHPAIYDDGFPEDPVVLDRMRAEPAREIACVATLYEAATYRRVLDGAAVFAAADARASAAEALEASGGEHARVPASVLVRISDARIQDRAVYLARGGIALPLYETQRPLDRPFVAAPEAVRPAESLPEGNAYLLLTSSGTFNWGHFLIDDLPKIGAVAVVRAVERRPLCVLLHGFVPAVDRRRIDLLRALLGSDLPVRLLRPDTHYRAGTLYYPSPVSAHLGPKHPRALADLAAAGDAMIARRDAGRWRRLWRPAQRPVRLFVIRRRNRGRVPAAWDAVRARITARGYVPFDPEGASAVEQAAAFASAERVIGCMGAAMAGSLFCRAGTRILYLAPATFPDPFYLDLAAARGHAYAVCYGTALDPRRPERSDYALDPDRLGAALAWLDRDG